MVEKFSAVIRVENLDSGMELSLHHFMELLKFGIDFLFSFDKENPGHTGAIIYKCDKPSSYPWSGNFSKAPNIRMNKRKQNQTFI
ncbi:unnamed protein product [Prunus armeniaca]